MCQVPRRNFLVWRKIGGVLSYQKSLSRDVTGSLPRSNVTGVGQEWMKGAKDNTLYSMYVDSKKVVGRSGFEGWLAMTLTIDGNYVQTCHAVSIFETIHCWWFRIPTLLQDYEMKIVHVSKHKLHWSWSFQPSNVKQPHICQVIVNPKEHATSLYKLYLSY